MSNPYAVYDAATGKVLRTGQCSNANDIILQAGQGQAVDDAPPVDADGILAIAADGQWTRAQDGTYSQVAPPPPPPPTTSELQTYASAKANALLGEAISYTAGPVTLKSDCTSGTLANWMALQQWATISPQNSASWVANDRTVTVLPASAVSALAVQVGNRAGSIYNALAAVLLAIEAGTITTTAQIDAAVWP